MHIAKTVTAALLAISALARTAIAGPFEDGFAAYQRGDDEAALQLLRPLAEQGDKNAEVVLGLLYEGGRGVPQSFSEAARWYRLAAEQGHLNGQFLLGSLYERGLGVPEDLLEAYKWFRLAALQGLADAYHKVGKMFVDGSALPKSDVDALAMFYIAGDVALEARQQLEPTMQPSTIILAKLIARDCVGPRMTECSWLPPAPAEDRPPLRPPATLPVPITSHALTRYDYPMEAIRAGEQGGVAVQFVVKVDGTVSECSTMQTSGKARIDAAACAFVIRRWKYKPATMAGTPIEFRSAAIIVFQLR
jgi:TonB family protein